MSGQQRDALDQLLRDAPLDLGADVAVQRLIFEDMMAASLLQPPGEWLDARFSMTAETVGSRVWADSAVVCSTSSTRRLRSEGRRAWS
jgi:hypothetical protein